jgi:uncharacterized protein (TIRG00374 family)
MRLGVSAAILTALAFVLPVGQVADAIRQVPPGVWGFTLVAFLTGHLVAATKWWLLVSLGGKTAPLAALRAHFAGLVANLCLPGAAGGDVVRAGWLMRKSDRKESIAVACVADRLVDCVALLTLTTLGAVWTVVGMERFGHVMLVAAGMLIVVPACFVAAHRLLKHRIRSGVRQRILGALAELGGRPGRLALCYVLSLTVQATFVMLNVMLGSASGVEVEPAAWFVAWPLAKLVATLPISLAGLGVRESSLAAFLAPFGGRPERVIAAGLAWQTVLIAGGLTGGLVVMLSGKSRRTVVVSPQECVA